MTADPRYLHPSPLDANRRYSYQSAREYCAALGMTFLEDWVDDADKVFADLALEQEDVDRLMQEYIWRVKHLFLPSAYPWRMRFLLALHFLNPFGK